MSIEIYNLIEILGGISILYGSYVIMKHNKADLHFRGLVRKIFRSALNENQTVKETMNSKQFSYSTWAARKNKMNLPPNLFGYKRGEE